MAGFIIQHISPTKGRGLYALQEYKKGDLIFKEKPLVCAQFSWNKFYGYLACDFCMRPLETAEENVKRLSGGSVDSLQYPECSPTVKSNHVECDQCQVVYCSIQCKEEAWNNYHMLICHTEESPLGILDYTWRKMHYPPESCTVMLLVRIIATIELSPNRENMYHTFKLFCSRSKDEFVMLEDKLGVEYSTRLQTLRELMQVCFPNATITRDWLFTEEGFQWLFTMVAVNGQGIGTSVLHEWVENVMAVDDNENNESLNKHIEDIYDKIYDHSGCQFLNNEGSALYDIESKCNHNCSPNAEVKFPDGNFTLNLVAFEDIKVGEEICISYIPLEKSRTKRNEALKSYYFSCDCAKCESQIGEPEDDSHSEEDSMSVDSSVSALSDDEN